MIFVWLESCAPSDVLDDKDLVQCSATRTKTTLFRLYLRFDHNRQTLAYTLAYRLTLQSPGGSEVCQPRIRVTLPSPRDTVSSIESVSAG